MLCAVSAVSKIEALKLFPEVNENTICISYVSTSIMKVA
jgi:hypothetical protein